jgi:hypothetical protein
MKGNFPAHVLLSPFKLLSLFRFRSSLIASPPA